MEEEKKVLDFEKPSKGTLTKLAFYGALIVLLFLMVHFAVKKGGGSPAGA
jgi:hypothetical protein